MHSILGILCITTGALGIVAYLAKGTLISTDEKIAMLLGCLMILIGFIIFFAGRK